MLPAGALPDDPSLLKNERDKTRPKKHGNIPP